jgi:hypothetical protein
MLKCREISHLIATDELAKGGWIKQLEVRFHLLMCRHCSGYAEQLKRLGVAARSLWAGPVTDEEREATSRIKEKLWSDISPDSPPTRGDDS